MLICSYMYESKNKKPVKIALPGEIGDGRVDLILRIFKEIKNNKNLILDWKRVQAISPAGFAILACLFDSIIENDVGVENVFVKKELKKYPVIKNILELKQYKKLPDPGIHNYYDENGILQGCKTFDIEFINNVLTGCGSDLSEEMTFSYRLISNELMQNTLAHSGAERFYVYAGKWDNDFHIGVLDMGVTIPAKMEQKYTCADDVKCLELALREGTSTRRERTGGLGLNHIFVLLKGHTGRLTILSRNAQIRRYFKRRVITKGELKFPLYGTWCFARFPLGFRKGGKE